MPRARVSAVLLPASHQSHSIENLYSADHHPDPTDDLHTADHHPDPTDDLYAADRYAYAIDDLYAADYHPAPPYGLLRRSSRGPWRRQARFVKKVEL